MHSDQARDSQARWRCVLDHSIVQGKRHPVDTRNLSGPTRLDTPLTSGSVPGWLAVTEIDDRDRSALLDQFHYGSTQTIPVLRTEEPFRDPLDFTECRGSPSVRKTERGFRQPEDWVLHRSMAPITQNLVYPRSGAPQGSCQGGEFAMIPHAIRVDRF